MRVDIVGAGPGGRAGVTLEGMRALEEAGLVIGARRILEALDLGADQAVLFLLIHALTSRQGLLLFCPVSRKNFTRFKNKPRETRGLSMRIPELLLFAPPDPAWPSVHPAQYI